MLIKKHKSRKRKESRLREVRAIVLKHDEEMIDGKEEVIFIRSLREVRGKIRVPRFFTNLAHKFRVKLNPRYADEIYDTDLYTRLPLETIISIMESWGCKINDENQYWYPNQVASGHLFFTNGRQLHIRVYDHGNGLYSLKAHVEWDGMIRPVMHIMYAGLDYYKGYRILKHLWLSSLKAIGIKEDIKNIN